MKYLLIQVRKEIYSFNCLVCSHKNNIQIIFAIGVNAWYVGDRAMPAVRKRTPSADEMWQNYLNSMAATNIILKK